MDYRGLSVIGLVVMNYEYDFCLIDDLENMSDFIFSQWALLVQVLIAYDKRSTDHTIM